MTEQSDKSGASSNVDDRRPDDGEGGSTPLANRAHADEAVGETAPDAPPPPPSPLSMRIAAPTATIFHPGLTTAPIKARTDATGAGRKPADGKTPPRVIVVVGMHRSGSSAVTRGLQALGVRLGGKLMRPQKGNNEKGFFEDLDIWRLNEALLEKAGSDWHKLARLDASRFTGKEYAAERREAAQILSKKIEDGATFAFKDPRTAILLPFWRCVFEDLGLAVGYVVTVRNPLDSAASLEARDGFPLHKGVYLWAKHMIDAVRETADRPRVFVSYDHLMDDPFRELERIAALFGLPAPDRDEGAVQEFRDSFLDADLRHNRAGERALLRSGLASPFIVQLYEALSRAANDDEPRRFPLSASEWRAIEQAFNEVAPLLDFADAADEKIEFLSEESASAGNEVRKLSAALREAETAADKEALSVAQSLKVAEATLRKKTADAAADQRRAAFAYQAAGAQA